MSKYRQVELVKERHLDRLLAMPNVTSVLVHFKRVGANRLAKWRFASP